jgi:hypothetical protein
MQKERLDEEEICRNSGLERTFENCSRREHAGDG